jgi:hypothetical protein
MTMTDLYQDFCNKIKENEPYCFSRWGDGEWNCILGVKGENCDGHTYFASLGEGLARVLRRRQRYFLGLQDFAMKRNGKRIAEWIQHNTAGTRWINADVFHEASKDDRLESLFRALRQRRTILVGPEHLTRLEQFSPDVFVQIDRKNCWLNYHNTISMLTAEYAEIQHLNPVVLLCAGMPAKILVDDMSDIQGITCIDIGSAFDPYAGVCSRRYHKEIV